jgi:prepilin signal peptidase PulO-like enzyme (type II secretory pathway)
MPSKIPWLKHVASLLILAAASWWWMGLFSESTRVHVLNIIVVVALYCANAFLFPRLSLGWRIAGFAVLTAIFLFVMFWPVEKQLLPDLLVYVLAYALAYAVSSLFSPHQTGARRTLWQAWRYLRDSRVREEEKAKAIIAEHRRTYPGSSLPDSR